MDSKSVVRSRANREDWVKSLRARLQWGLLTLVAGVLTLFSVLVYALARDRIRGDADQFVSDKARLLAQATNPLDLTAVHFDERDWRDDRLTPFGQTFDVEWNPRFLSRRLSRPILPTDEVKRYASHPLGMVVHDAAGQDGQLYRMATVSIERGGESLGYAQIGIRHAERDAPLQRLQIVMLGGGLVALALAAVGIQLTLRQWQLPMANFVETARNVAAEGAARHRFVAPPDSPELVQVARAFNQLLDRLAALQESQQHFIADAAHELRTPLTVLRGELEVTLRRQRTPEEYRETIVSCREEIERLSRLTDNLLALARLDSGPALELAETLDLGTACREAAERLAAQAQDRGVHLAVDATAALPILGDRLALERVFGNLLENAVRYTPRGETVAVRAFRQVHEAVAEVIDGGPGIAAEDQTRIFDRFYRVESSRSRERNGAGLGLAIVKSLVTAHGGTVDLRSRIGRGSTFVVRLPLADGRGIA